MTDKTTRRLPPSVLMFTCGLAAGIIIAVGVANTWPRARLAPVFYAKNMVHFGVAEDGRPALCGDDGVAYTPMESGGLSYMAHQQDGVILTQKCKDKIP